VMTTSGPRVSLTCVIGFLIELDPLYCDVIVQRWEQFTGRTAKRKDVTATRGQDCRVIHTAIDERQYSPTEWSNRNRRVGRMALA